MSFKLAAAATCSLLILGGCGAAADPDASSNLSPQPPMWVVSDADSEITLYPTLHLLPAGMKWQSAELAQRLAAADEVWFEVKPGPQTEIAVQKAVLGLGAAPEGTSLSDSLTEAEISALKQAVAPLNLPFEFVNQLRPWAVATFVGVGTLISEGFDPKAGVEKQLLPLTKGKKIRGLETAGDQIKMLASLPDDVQLKMLRDALADYDEGVAVLKEVAADWAVGDVEDLDDDLLDEMKSELPAAYKALFTDRNKNWTDQIEIEMKGSGTDFIAVGAGHLVGEDGVPAMLRARGYKVTRL